MKRFFLLLFWFLSLIIVCIYTYENPELIDTIKNYLKKNLSPKVKLEEGMKQHAKANSFSINFSKVISLGDRTAFIIHDNESSNFNKETLKIYTQNGYLLENFKSKKINLLDNFTTKKNGGLKTLFVHKNNTFALISSLKGNCFYASIILLNQAKEIFKTKCLKHNMIDFNGLGSSNIHYKNKIFVTIGAPEQVVSDIANLAQNDESMFGKIIEIDKSDLDSIIEGSKSTLAPTVFTKGHRNPQGITRIKDSIF